MMTQTRRDRLEKIKQLHSQKKTVKELAEELNVSTVTIAHDLSLLKLKANRPEKKEQIKLNYFNKQKEALLKEGWIEYKGILFHKDHEYVWRSKENSKNIYKIIPKPVNKKYGYKTISVNHKNTYLHRVKWEAFNHEIPKDMSVMHIDGDMLNNKLSNLRLASQSDISKKTIKRTISKGQIIFGEAQRKKVKCLQNNITYNSIAEAFEKIGINKAQRKYFVKHINGEKETINGYTFKLINEE